ncbi:triose-phosphate isomerase [Pseudomonas aeruginosa]
MELLLSAVVAYEPVWAIRLELTRVPAQAREVHAAIRAQLAAENAEVAKVCDSFTAVCKGGKCSRVVRHAGYRWGLVGGASLSTDEFGAICRAAGKLKMLERS